MSSEHLQQLERDLRDARTAFDDVPVSPDAWQRNQELVAAGAPDRRRTVTAVAAAVAVLLVLGVSWLAFGGDNRADDVPGSDGRSDSSSSGAMADPVQVAKIDLPDGTVTLEVGMEEHAEKADEPSFCYEMNSASTDGASASGAGGCTSKVDRADLPGVTVDYLTGSNDEVWTTLTGAVDERAAALTMWLADGTIRDLDLVDLPGSEFRGFGSLGNSVASIRPQRLVAYADAQRRDVLEVVDLRDSFGPEWLPGPSSDDCTQSTERVELPNWLQVVSATPVRGSLYDLSPTIAEDHGPWCSDLDGPVQGFHRSGKEFTLLIAPEVGGLRVAGKDQPVQTDVPRQLGSTMWRVQRLVSEQQLQTDDEIVAVDAAGDEIGRVPVRSLVERGGRAPGFRTL